MTRLLTAFYFRQHGIENSEQTFEFTHKGFGEYVTASRLTKMIQKISKQIKLRQFNDDDRWDEKTSLKK